MVGVQHLFFDMWITSKSLAVRATPITPETKSTAVKIATLLLMSIFLIMFLSREAIKFVVLRKFGADDFLIALATVCDPHDFEVTRN